MNINIFGIILRKAPPGEFAPYIMWIILHDGYMYESPSLIKTILLFIKEYKHDRHMIG